MNYKRHPFIPLPRGIRRFFFLVPAIVLLAPRAPALDSAAGIAIVNQHWTFVATDDGYSDLVLDQRPGFENREYLSGEWAAAICYSGGTNPAGPIWLRKEWAFPCWQSNSNFIVIETVNIPSATPNADGFFIYRSIIRNADVEITMTYQMRDSVTGIRQGGTRASVGGAGFSTLSSRYYFQQTYSIKNISGGPLTNLKFYQFLHGLDSGTSLYDNRNYGGPAADYRFDNTQIGTDFSFHRLTGAVYEHTDTITMHLAKQPGSYEVGYFGREGVDDHRVGKPSVGVHLSVEAANLNNLDFFDPPEERWVSGAMCLNLANLAAGQIVDCDVLLSLHTVSQMRHPAPDLRIFDTGIDPSGNFFLDFEDRNNVPVDGYILRSNPTLQGAIPQDWPQVPVPRFIDVPRPGASRFVIPRNPAMMSDFFVVEAIFED